MSAHHIEERAIVYLRLNEAGDGWEIDGPTVDGYPLEGYDNGALNEACECEGGAAACDAALRRAADVPLPTAQQLLTLLQEAIARG